MCCVYCVKNGCVVWRVYVVWVCTVLCGECISMGMFCKERVCVVYIV